VTVIGRSVTGKAPLNAIVIVARHYDGSNLSQLFRFQLSSFIFHAVALRCFLTYI
jgi:hypothetical protein